MGNSAFCALCNREPIRELTLAILGIDNAGKTTASKGLIGQPLQTAPTVGFSSETVILNQYKITMFDLGGGEKFRGIWKQYFAEVYGIIYVIDSSSVSRINETKETLRNLLADPQVSGKPILLLANKQDKQGALDEVDVCNSLHLEDLVNLYKCPCQVKACSATLGTGKKVDENIKSGLMWICTIINCNFDSYKTRVAEDIKIQMAKNKKEEEERRERVKKIREEREKKLAEEGKIVEEEDEEEPAGFNPFKKIDIKDLERKEEEIKRANTKVKTEELVITNVVDETNINSNYSESVICPENSVTNVNDIITADRLSESPSVTGQSAYNVQKSESSFCFDSENESTNNVLNFGAKSQLPPIGAPFSESIGKQRKNKIMSKEGLYNCTTGGMVEKLLLTDKNYSNSKQEDANMLISTISNISPKLIDTDTTSPNCDFMLMEQLKLATIPPVESGESDLDKKMKIKKKRLKRNNKLAPSPESLDDEGRQSPFNDGSDQSSKRSTPVALFTTASRLNGVLNNKGWALEDELDAVKPMPLFTRLKPNTDENEDIVT